MLPAVAARNGSLGRICGRSRVRGGCSGHLTSPCGRIGKVRSH